MESASGTGRTIRSSFCNLPSHNMGECDRIHCLENLVRTTMDEIDLNLLIKACSITGHGGIYGLRPIRSPLHIFSRQTDVINLVWALTKTGRLTAGSRVAVLGGDISGVTTAVALLGIGCHVDLFERGSDLLQGGSSSYRYAHPNLDNWPAGDASPTTRLPFLEWYAAPLAEVLETIAQQATDLLRGASVYLERDIQAISILDQGEIELRFSSNQRIHKDSHYNAIFLSDDFAEQRTIGNFRSPSYWQADSLDISQVDRYIVSGHSDRALMDALRLVHRKFENGRLLQEIARLLSSTGIGARIFKGEREAFNATNPDQILSRCYVQAVAELPRVVSDRLLISLLPAVDRCILTSNAATPYSSGALPILKLLIAHAISVQAIRYIRGSLRMDHHTLKIGELRFPVESSEILIRHDPSSRFDLLFSASEIDAYRIRQKVLTARSIALWDTSFPVPAGLPQWDFNNLDFRKSRSLLARRFVSKEFGAQLILTTNGYTMTAPSETHRPAPSDLFGVPTIIETSSTIDALAGPGLRLEAIYNTAPTGMGGQPNNRHWSGFLLQRLNAAKAAVATHAEGLIAADCFKILNFIEDEKPGRMYVFTLERLCEITGRSKIDDGLIATLNLLSGSACGILTATAIFVDGVDLHAVSLGELAEAKSIGELLHPLTGTRISNFEHFIIPFFRLGSALTGANQ
jgi:hypothetical protein